MTNAQWNGLKTGAKWARVYATGTRADRREIRRKLHRMADAYNPFVSGVWEGFADVAGQWAADILEGRKPRTCNPHKLQRVLERV